VEHPPDPGGGVPLGMRAHRDANADALRS
jgi:hypothetical protein